MTNIIVRSVYQTLTKSTYKILGMPSVENYNGMIPLKLFLGTMLLAQRGWYEVDAEE